MRHEPDSDGPTCWSKTPTSVADFHRSRGHVSAYTLANSRSSKYRLVEAKFEFFMSPSANDTSILPVDVGEKSPDGSVWRLGSLPVHEKDGSPPDYYAPSTVAKDNQQSTTIAAGRLPEEIYTNTLPSWRLALRQRCLVVVERESEIIARWQVRPLLLSAGPVVLPGHCRDGCGPHG